MINPRLWRFSKKVFWWAHIRRCVSRDFGVIVKNSFVMNGIWGLTEEKIGVPEMFGPLTDISRKE